MTPKEWSRIAETRIHGAGPLELLVRGPLQALTRRPIFRIEPII